MAAAVPGRARMGWRNTTAGELVSEALGTFIIIAFGDGVVAMAVAALNQSGRGTKIFDASGDWLLIGWGWGFAVTFAVYVAGGVSGAHLNPAVTLALALRRGFAWAKVPGYMVAQVLGA
ncbi:MAG: glycerol uptake facilitator protein, partial [Solirubrobacteraceae bacterium]|nr:glycerol uptake facilitator protein [Solirubrobacteraceae bacterium]